MFLVGLILGAALGFLAAKRREVRLLAARRRAATREVEGLTRAQLYERAQAADIPGRSAMSKEELREALEANEPSLSLKIVQTVQTVSGREPDQT